MYYAHISYGGERDVCLNFYSSGHRVLDTGVRGVRSRWNFKTESSVLKKAGIQFLPYVSIQSINQLFFSR